MTNDHSEPSRGKAVVQFRKKPVVVEAIRWDGDPSTFDTIKKWSGGQISDTYGYALLIPTLEGTMAASLNNWIIRGVKGELYPCKPDIFAATYEPAAASPAPAASGGLEAVREAAKDIIASRSSTYKARNGRVMGIEDDTGEMMWIVPFDEMHALETALAAPAATGEEAVPSWAGYVTNCCNCGRVVDTREKSEGGDDFGCELAEEGRWVCSPECWDAVVGVNDPHPAPSETGASVGVKVKALEWRDVYKTGVANDMLFLTEDSIGLGSVYRIVNTVGLRVTLHRQNHCSEIGRFDTLEDAQRAAQEDYETRIRAALEVRSDG